MQPTRFISKGSQSLFSLIHDCKSIKQLKQIHAQIIATANPPDPTFFISRLLFACATTGGAAGTLSYASAIFQQIHDPTLFVYNCIIRIHSIDPRTSNKCLSLYKRMLRCGIRPDRLTFPFLLKGCVRSADLVAGRGLHCHVLKLGFHPDVYVQNVVIGVYAGTMNGKKNVITWNSIITGFVQGGRPKEALEIFHEMQNIASGGVSPDGITLATVLSACATLGALDQGKWVHRYLRRRGLEFDVVIGTALVDMYGKCGCVDQATEAFQEIMPKKDVLAWTAMINVFSDHGLAGEAIELFKEMVMCGIKPNPVTFVPVLSACAHAGLVQQGWEFFNLMRSDQFCNNIAPQAEHYACMVDLLARAGLFQAATDLIRDMEVEPDVYVWGALLGGCRMHGNVGLGEKVALHLINLEPHNHVFYVALADIYGKACRFVDGKRVRALMVERGIKKTFPGCSMIEIDGTVYEFSVQGSSQVVMSDIEDILDAVSFQMKSDSIDALLENGS
ncbi:hypothetical protein H6P81_016488 [Aristolochia fimbriata]|uniref:Pentatricopeptide repeat-containing protein n=1 Tax=Aristolochia fimbriata TaxID=158543 RepID=A0AAV7E8K0_ARIFI|nr:hypothetical protein H6P81_016488 [Aristolochia fimbriata]